MSRLTPTFEHVAMDAYQDFLAVTASNIESSFLLLGAKPNIDYTFRDLMQLAAPVAATAFNDGKLLLNVGEDLVGL